VRKLVLLLLLAPGSAGAEPPPAPDLENWSLHAQATVVGQWHFGFHSPYEGPNSLSPDDEIRDTVTATLFLGRRLWSGAAIYVNPEVTQGTGLSETLGVAGFPNGEATRAGTETPRINLARLFLRQTIGLGGGTQRVEPGANQLGSVQDENHLTFTIGKLAAVDLFDGNAISHDPRTQFFNWALMDNGAWDYPADAKGYTNGAAIELETVQWSLRWGAFMVPKVANGEHLDWDLRNALGNVLELERRWALAGRAGSARLLGYVNRSDAGSYHDALHAGLDPPVIETTRRTREKYGFGLSADQEIARDLGAFCRLGWNDGHTETWAFTEIDRTASVGARLTGTRWARPDDEVGLAGVVNGISQPHRRYLDAGGLGFIIGDGQLRYGVEGILEAYYRAKIKWFQITFDYQLVENPAYNRDRGPVSIFAARLHWEY
jgi:high affinity Mn2+ porin